MEYLPYLLLIIVLLVAGMQLGVLVAAKRRSGQPAPDFSVLLDEGLKNEKRFLLYFFSLQCGPCRGITPIVDELASRHANVLKVDVTLHMALARDFRILGTPSFVVVQDGVVESMQVGGTTPARLEKLLMGE